MFYGLGCSVFDNLKSENTKMDGFPLNPVQQAPYKSPKTRESADLASTEQHALVDFELPPEIAARMRLQPSRLENAAA